MAAVVVARLSQLSQPSQSGVTDGPGGVSGYVVARNGHQYALWVFEGGEVRVLDNACLHVGGPLAEGMIDDGCVVCPWHGWTYELATGQRRTALGVVDGVGCYRAWVEGDEVWAELPDAAEPPASAELPDAAEPPASAEPPGPALAGGPAGADRPDDGP